MDKEEKKILTILLLIVASLALLVSFYIKFEIIQKNYLYKIFEQNFDVYKLGDSKKEKQIKYGYELVFQTPNHIGPDVFDVKKRYAGNNLSCKNCHLNSGKKSFAMPFIGVSKRFPQFLARENKIESLENRINGCMERSLNGRSLEHDSAEMRAIIAYMNWLSKDVPKNYNLRGSGFAKINIPNRKVNLQNGKIIYQNNCASCHQPKGEGVKSDDDYQYIYPPLWGSASYNDGAGMARTLTAAQFIKGNMPFGTVEEHPFLNDDQAFDVAGYVNNFSRPKKINSEKDYPNLKLKPVSSPYGPYVDKFSIEQHRFGPYQEIIDYYQNNFAIKKDK